MFCVILSWFFAQRENRIRAYKICTSLRNVVSQQSCITSNAEDPHEDNI